MEDDPLRPGQSCVVESRVLTDEQARNLVIRPGAGKDVIEVDPNVPLAITSAEGTMTRSAGAPAAAFGSAAAATM